QKGDYETILSSFANREADILVGTQMIVKGHDFPYVTLVGILAADMSLNANDFRAGERTFQLLVQASGRAGRDTRPGEVIIQTYRPDHYAITAAMTQDYEAFYEEEIGYRSLLGYPPCGHMLAIMIESGSERECSSCAGSLAEVLRNGIISNVSLIGPTPATISRMKDIYRYMIYIKSESVDMLVKIKDNAEEYCNTLTSDVRISFDLDPMNSY
ncbi:MAG: primosomal protein N', partial [Lachnospiraceae bacterium]|nr:primosomal protein N' [Lachnospiraceae bacterium]